MTARPARAAEGSWSDDQRGASTDARDPGAEVDDPPLPSADARPSHHDLIRGFGGPAPLAIGSARAGIAAAGSLAAYLVVSLLAGSAGVDLVGLVTIPCAVAAAFLGFRLASATIGVALFGTLVLLALPGSDDPEDVAALIELVVMVAAAILLRGTLVAAVIGRRAQARREAELTARLGVLLSTAQRLGRTLDREAIFHLILDQTARHLAADATTIRVLRGDQLELAAWRGLSDDDAARLPTLHRADPWLTQVMSTGRPVARRDVIDEVGLADTHGRLAAVIGFRGNLIAPLILDGRVIGTLSAVTAAPRAWSDGDIDFIAGLAAHAAVALNNAELFERAENRARQFSVLQAASTRLTLATTDAEVGDIVLQELRRILDYHNARVYVIQAPDLVAPIAVEGDLGLAEPYDIAAISCRLGEGLTGWVAQHGEPLLIADANADPRAAQIPGTDDVDESMLIVPMQADRTTFGVVTVSKLGLGQFGVDDLQLLSILAGQAATSLESIRRLRRSEDLSAELRRLLDMSSTLSQSLDPREVALLIAQHLAQATGVDESVISYWDRPGDQLLTLGCHPIARMDELVAEFPLTGYPESRRVLETGTAAVIDAEDPRADPAEVLLLRRDGMRTLAMVPLVAKGRSIGLVELLARSVVDFDEGRLALARTMANEAAMALENARLYEDARNLADRDPLTGFYNHRFLHERLAEEVLRARRARRPLSLLMLDLDDFKLVNDSFGHQLGDRVLTWTADRIRATLRATDVPARYGGDEFAILLPETDAAAAELAARRILDVFRTEAFESEGRGPLPVAVSIGAATFPDDGSAATLLLAAADRRLYVVKDRGGQAGLGADLPAGRASIA